jgi:hypothetical protein
MHESGVPGRKKDVESTTGVCELEKGRNLEWEVEGNKAVVADDDCAIAAPEHPLISDSACDVVEESPEPTRPA